MQSVVFERTRMLPNFIIVGAPKSGTTSLYHYLSEHPQVFMSEPKEVNYFSREEIEAQGLYYSDFKVKDFDSYKMLFSKGTDKKAVGEGSVSYLFYPETAKKIKAVLPNIKIIILLRNPLERGYSHYLMDFRLGLVDLTYDEIVFKTVKHKNLDLYYQQYVELGLYYQQVARYVDFFGSKQVKIYLQEDLRNNPESIIEDLYDYLEVDKSFTPNIDQEYNSFSMPKNGLIQKIYGSYIVRATLSKLVPNSMKELLLNTFFERTKKPKLSIKTEELLLALYKIDIENLEKLINLDLSNWYGGKNV